MIWYQTKGSDNHLPQGVLLQKEREVKRLQTPKIQSFKEPNRLQRYTFYQKVSTPPP